MDPVPLLLVLLASLPLSPALYSGPLQAEITNGTFHHFFVPDGHYEETEDLEQCQMLFRFSDGGPCGGPEERDSAVRDDLVIAKLQAEDAARQLEGIGRTVEQDLDGEDTYGKFLQRELSQISEAFSSVDKSLSELEGKFKQSQETELREEQQLNGYVMKQVGDIRDTVRRDRRRLCGTAGQAGAAVPDRPEPRNQAELPEDGVSERGLLVSRTSTSRMKEDLKLGSS
ncbi:unnamed protein product [Tetraodon nigroviridis]|uniref:(spotted green pufferfish) hypothetical protein n=1 Tax=Tetraodon nigroviridis TaxID=99883 RepID=Q4TIB3_TETNG|nr:unnamed protein product [Tetraodon nigroviridis]